MTRVDFEPAHTAHSLMWAEIRRRNHTQSSFQFFHLKTVLLGKRGRASEKIQAGKSWIISFNWNGKSVCMRVGEIIGVQANQEWCCVGFFGPVWRVKRVPLLFEVREFHVIEDRMRDGMIFMKDVGFPAFVSHRHTFRTISSVSLFRQRTRTSQRAPLSRCCHFNIACQDEHHDAESERFCEECLSLLGEQKHMDHSKQSYNCKDFQKVNATLECPQIDDWLNPDGETSDGSNLNFRVYYGNCGYLPGLYEKRPTLADGTPQPHMGQSFLSQ